MSKILLVEDERSVSEPISDFLKFDGHNLELVIDGAEALLRLRVSDFDLIILDWQLPKVTGIEVLQEYRRRGGQSPVLMLTGKSEVASKTTGLDAGADDYLTKPFDMRELSSRVRALLRRPSQTIGNVLSAGPLSIDVRARRCCLSGVEIKLVPKEFAVLEFLIKNKGIAFNSEELLKKVWESDTESSQEAVRQCIARLRKKLETAQGPTILTTVIGSGYRIENI